MRCVPGTITTAALVPALLALSLAACESPTDQRRPRRAEQLRQQQQRLEQPQPRTPAQRGARQPAGPDDTNRQQPMPR